MADQLQLRVVTPRRQVIDQSVTEVTAPGTLGEFGVLPDHATFLSSLETGRLLYRDSRALHSLAIRGGFAEVSDNVMTVLVEEAVPADSIDAERAKAELADAEARIERLSPVEPEFEAADTERRWALARIDAAGKK